MSVQHENKRMLFEYLLLEHLTTTTFESSFRSVTPRNHKREEKLITRSKNHACVSSIAFVLSV